MFSVYRVTHKGCDFSDDLNLLKSSKCIGLFRLDKPSTVVVEVASFVGNPVHPKHQFLNNDGC